MTAAASARVGADAGMMAGTRKDALITEYRFEVAPRWPFRLPRFSAANGLTVIRGGVLRRFICVPGGDGVLARVAIGTGGEVLFGLRARTQAAAQWAFTRLRVALGVDLDLREFHRRFKDDPLIGDSIRRQPALRIVGRVTGFEALACAITEQLIEFERASAIQRRIIRLLGPLEEESGLRDFPQAGQLAGVAPALLAGCDLAASRSRALREVAKLAASGCVVWTRRIFAVRSATGYGCGGFPGSEVGR